MLACKIIIFIIILVRRTYAYNSYVCMSKLTDTSSRDIRLDLSNRHTTESDGSSIVIKGKIEMEKHIQIPASDEEIKSLHAGDMLYLSGTIYTARDAAHKRMYDTLQGGGNLPYDIEGSFVYYLGPTPARPGQVIGSAGPTTSSRMDKYTPLLLSKGLKGMIGKGKRSPEVIDAIVKEGAIYCAAIGGLGALLSKRIVASEVIAYDDLGTEAIRKMTVENLPVVVIVDTEGNNLYETAASDYLASK